MLCNKKKRRDYFFSKTFLKKNKNSTQKKEAQKQIKNRTMSHFLKARDARQKRKPCTHGTQKENKMHTPHNRVAHKKKKPRYAVT